MTLTKSIKILAVFEIITGIGILLFWIGFFTIGMAPKTPPECYFTFEHCFPLPDSILSIVIIIAGILLVKGKESGRVLSLAGAGGLVFLGVLDFSFNIQYGMYAITVMDTVLNAFINAWCAGFGIAMVIGLRSGK